MLETAVGYHAAFVNYREACGFCSSPPAIDLAGNVFESLQLLTYSFDVPLDADFPFPNAFASRKPLFPDDASQALLRPLIAWEQLRR